MTDADCRLVNTSLPHVYGEAFESKISLIGSLVLQQSLIKMSQFFIQSSQSAHIIQAKQKSSQSKLQIEEQNCSSHRVADLTHMPLTKIVKM